MSNSARKFTAVVLAGDRGPDDPIARAAGVPCKALVPVAGRPMVLRVLDALRDSKAIEGCLVCGSAERLLEQNREFAQLVAAGDVRWLENKSSPSLSALASLQALPGQQPILLTTADHALLTPPMVEHFCSKASQMDCDVVAGLAPAELVTKTFPEGRRTITRLRGASYCGCNLFAFLTLRSHEAAAFWRRIEAQRKHPLKIVKILGWPTVLRYLLGGLTLEAALKRLSMVMEVHAGAVWMPFAEAAVDVDKLEDWQLVEKILAERQKTS